MKYKLLDGILMQAVADETVILDPVSGVYFTLDAVGSRMLALLQESNDGEVVAARIAEEYTVEPSEALVDLNDLLAQMAKHGLAEEVGVEAG